MVFNRLAHPLDVLIAPVFLDLTIDDEGPRRVTNTVGVPPPPRDLLDDQEDLALPSNGQG